MMIVMAIQNSDDFISPTVNAPQKKLSSHHNQIILRVALHFNAQF